MAAKKVTPLTSDAAELVPFTFRIPRGLVADLDAMLEELRRERQAFQGINRSDLIREALHKAVEAHKAERKPKR